MVRLDQDLKRMQFFLLLVIFLLPSVSASPDSYTLTSSTGDVDLIAGVQVKINYSCHATVSHPSTIGKDETASWSINLDDSSINISVYVPSPVSQWYSASRTMPIGSYYDIQITTGISARVKVVSSVSLDLTGDATLSTDSLSWSYEGTKTFEVISYDYASGVIIVESNFNFQINLGLVIGLSSFSIEIANTPLGTFPASPKVSESMTVSIQSPTFYEQIIGFIFSPLGLLILFIAFITVAMIISARRKRKEQERRETAREFPKPPKRFTVLVPKARTKEAIYCMYCGEKLPSRAVYCRKCGKKVE